MFLTYAIEYTLDKDYAAENNKNINFPDQEVSFLGIKNVLNMFCILISDHMLSTNQISEFYSNLSFFSKLYADIFQPFISSTLNC